MSGQRLRGDRRRGGIAVWLWGLAAVLAVAVLVVAIVGRDRGGGPTLRAMAASESMAEEQARAVADTTVRVWMRERNEQHLDNLEALSCPDRDGLLAKEVDAVKNGEMTIAYGFTATARFLRHGPAWTLDVFFTPNKGAMFTLRIMDGELRVCRIEKLPAL